MTSILKNQILKHISRYAKNLSSDQINVSTLKGEGELKDLELDEEVLTELLALPIWMKITKAHCNRARLQISWTKLKTVPIRLILDTIHIEIEACEELRPVVSTSSHQLTVPAAGKYGFVNKVVDGVTVTVEAVEIKFSTKTFESKVQISRIKVESKSPNWKKVELPHTRLKDVEKGELLTFKEIEWTTLKIEAKSTKDKHLAPLRLLTNQAKSRVVIKKKLIDCSVVGCRLSVILDDLLWVLTDSQILAAAHFVTSLSGLIKQATETVQAVKAARKLESLPEHLRANKAHERLVRSESSKVFDAFDVKETSYHLNCEQINLHFCDDPGGGRSNHPDLINGSAGQVQLTNLMVDFYPYHFCAKLERKNVFRYVNTDLNYWLKENLAIFKSQTLTDLFPKSIGGSNLNSPVDSDGRKLSNTAADVVTSRLHDQLGKLMSTNIIFRIRDVCMYKVTTSSKESPMPFLSSYMERPKDVCAINVEATSFYYPSAVSFPLPSPKLYAQINPLQIHIDVCTILWLNSFVTHIDTTMPRPHSTEDKDYVDVRLELIMPKIIFEEKRIHPVSSERPSALQIQCSRVLVSNYRSNETGSRNQLSAVICDFEKSGSTSHIPSKFVLHSKGLDGNQRKPSSGSGGQLSTDLLWSEARDVWFVSVDTVWADFCVDTKMKHENDEPKRKFRSGPKTSQPDVLLVPFIDSLPLNVWLHSNEELIDEEYAMGKRKDIGALLWTDGMCNIQLSHEQFMFLLRTAEAISEISIFLTIDTRKTYIVPRKDDSVEVFGCLPHVAISLVLPCSDTNLIRETSSLLDELEPDTSRTTMPEAPSDHWDHTQNETPKKESSVFFPESPEKFYSDLPISGSPTTASLDNMKSSLSQGVKQGFSNLVVSFTKGGGHVTPDSEVTSMWSTDSSENNFITLEPESDAAAATIGEDVEIEETVEVAEEVIEDNSHSTGSFSIHNPYGKEDTVEISVMTIGLDGVQIGQKSEGLSSEINLHSRSITVDVSNQIPWKDFQTLFSTRSKKFRADTEKRKLKTDINNAITANFSQRIDDITFMNCMVSEEMTEALKRVKSTKYPRVNLIDWPGSESPIRKAIIKSTNPHLKANIDLREGRANEGQFITLHSIILSAVADFFDDEVPPTVLPLQAHVIGACIEIVDDKNSNLPPTKFCIQDYIMVTRNEDGAFNIGCPCEQKSAQNATLCNGEDDNSSDKDSILELRQENTKLKELITALERDKEFLRSQLRNS